MNWYYHMKELVRLQKELYFQVIKSLLILFCSFAFRIIVELRIVIQKVHADPIDYMHLSNLSQLNQ